LQYSELKDQGKVGKVIVTGCLSERYKPELEAEITNVDSWFGTNDLQNLLHSVGADYKHELIGERLLTTPSHFAYFKIAEGCNRPCSFCAIPLMRGKHVSMPMEELVNAAKKLAKNGTKELILIAQDLTYYGLDIYGKRNLDDLLRRLSDVDGIEWIRLQYAYPSGFPMEILDAMNERDNICKYLDMPLQHITDNMLKSMRRGTNPANAAAPTAAPQVSLPVPELQFVDSRKLDRAPDQTVFKKLVRTPWRVAAVYVLAGCAFALIMAAAVLLSMGDNEFLPGRFVSLFWIFVWPAVLTINIVAAANFRTKLAVVLLYFLVLAGIAIGMNLVSKESNWSSHATLWFLYDVPASLILLAFLNRRIRAVGPLVLIFLMVSAFGALFALLLLGSSEAAMRLAANLGPGAEVTLIALSLFGFVLTAPIGWLMLRWIRKRYESKKTSDHAIAVDTIWLLFGVVMSIELSPNGLWALSGLFAFLIYKIVSLTGLRLIRPSSGVNHKLLVLRVFSLGKRSQRLFRWLAMYSTVLRLRSVTKVK